MKLVTSPICPFAQRAWLVLEHTGLPYEKMLVSISPGEKSEAFTQIYRSALGADQSSDGKVPVLDDDGFVIAESALIAEYVAGKSAAEGKVVILPQTPKEKYAHGLVLEQTISPFTGPFYGLLMGQTEEVKAAQKLKLDAAIAKIDKTLAGSGGPFLLGAKVMLADFLLWPFIERMCVNEHYRGYKVSEDNKHFAAWRAAMEALPACAATKQAPEFFIKGYEKYANGTK